MQRMRDNCNQTVAWLLYRLADVRLEWAEHLLSSELIRLRRADPQRDGYGLSWTWGQEHLEFLPEKALWRPEGRELLIADLHLGKAEVFQAHGIPLPSDGDRGTFNPLLDLCSRVYSPRPSSFLVI